MHTVEVSIAQPRKVFHSDLTTAYGRIEDAGKLSEQVDCFLQAADLLEQWIQTSKNADVQMEVNRLMGYRRLVECNNQPQIDERLMRLTELAISLAQSKEVKLSFLHVALDGRIPPQTELFTRLEQLSASLQ